MHLIVAAAVVFLSFVGTVCSHPVFQHKFHAIVNANPCLKECMDNATNHGKELSLLKSANITDYFLNLDSTCTRIEAARNCIATCDVGSNPFALESMQIVCSDESVLEVQRLESCLLNDTAQERTVHDVCVEECGDYDLVNDKVHNLTKALDPQNHESEQIADIMGHVNSACGTLKCSDRCTARVLAERCGEQAGKLVRSLVERVLEAHRRDLDRLHLADTMSMNVPIQCNYLYMPETMFNRTKDELAMAAIAETMKGQPSSGKHPIQPTGEGKHGLNLALSQMVTRLLQKQLHVTDMQEEVLRRESRKLDMEISLLVRKVSATMPQMVDNVQF